MERRLAAILATDVVGYSRLIRADEEGTIAALRGVKRALFNLAKATAHTTRRHALATNGRSRCP